MRMVRGAHSPQTVNSVHEREGGCNTARYSCPPQPYPGHAGGHKLTTRGRADPPASRHGCVTPSPTRHVGRSVRTPQHKPNHPNHPSHHSQHRDTDTPPKRPATHDARRRTADRQARARAQHHRAGTTPWGSHGEHRDTPRGTGGALPPTGGVHMSGTSETGSTATEHHEIPDNGLCMQHCQGGAGNRAPTGETFFSSGETTCHGFSPPRRVGGAQYKRTVPAPLTWHRPTSQQAEHLHTTNRTARAPAATTRNERRTNQPRGD